MKSFVWEKRGFEEFMKGTLGNGGQNLYVSRKGILQRIHQYDITGNGYVDIFFANSHSMGERPPLHLYNNVLEEEPVELPVRGSFDACMADLTGDGKMDLIVASQHDGVLSDTTATVYFSSERGYTEKYMTELAAPGAVAVAAGDFRGNGKNDVIFGGGGRLRIFEQTALGIESCKFRDISLDAISISAGDLDGDGYADLYVLTQQGRMSVYWGSPEGITAENYTELPGEVYVDEEIVSTTAGRFPMRRMPWCTSVLTIYGRTCLFRAEDGDAVFESFDREREAHIQLRIPAGGAVYAVSGPVTGEGNNDLVILVQTDRDKAENSLLLLEKDGYKEEKAIPFPTRAARTATISPLKKGGRNYLFVAQISSRETNEKNNQILLFDGSGRMEEKYEIPGMCTARICVGDTGRKEGFQAVVINHEGGRPHGKEDIYIYLGDEEGYHPEQRIELPGLAAVEGAMIDFTDNGHPDVMVVNCAENAPHLCEGIYIYHNDGEGPDRDKCEKIPMILPHGAAVGDFRKCGYLDIVTGGIRNREIRIYQGGPDGYSADRVQKIVFGPEAETFVPFPWDKEDVDPDYSAEENVRIREFGGLRWLYTADFNGDGYLDLFVSQITGKNCMILWGGPDGFSVDNMQVLATCGAGCANVADLDGDGYPDLILGGHMAIGKKEVRESYVTIYWGSEKGFSENRKTCLPGWCINSIAVGDFNNDGLLDIFITSYSNSRVRDLDSYIYYGQNDGTFSRYHHARIFNHSGCGCIAGDFNKDGYTDLAMASHKKEGNHICSSYVFWGGPDGIQETNCTELPTIGCHGMTTVDIGNVMDRSDDEFYDSEIYEVPEGMKMTSAEWKAENGVATSVSLLLKTADTREGLEAMDWEVSAENGEDLSDKKLTGKYIQYRLVLTARSGCGTPRVEWVRIHYEQ